MTSANSAVSVRKMSWTTRKSSAASALRTLLMLGSDRNGFSPSMYMPRTPPLRTEPMISVTVRPALGVQVRGAPGLLEPGPDVRVVGLLVVRVEHRDQAHVGGALHVVLPAQRVQPGARRPTFPVIAHIAMRQRALSVPVVCWEMPIPQKMIPASASPQARATRRITSAGTPVICSARSGG